MVDRRTSPRVSPRLASGPAAERAYRALGDAQLVRALRCGDVAALDEFMLRFSRLLADRACRTRLTAAEASDLAQELLEDVGLRILAGEMEPPQAIGTYLCAAFRHRYLTQLREHERHARLVREHVEDAGATGEATLWSASSEHLRRLSHGPAWEPFGLAPVLERLASAFDEGVSEDERRLLQWVSHYIPQREIASWLGVSYGAVTQRIWRLRERLREMAVRFAATLDAAEQRELKRFFRRWAFEYEPMTDDGTVTAHEQGEGGQTR